MFPSTLDTFVEAPQASRWFRRAARRFQSIGLLPIPSGISSLGQLRNLVSRSQYDKLSARSKVVGDRARLTFSSGAGAVAIVVNDRKWYSTGYRRARFWIAFIIASDSVASNRHNRRLESGPSHRARPADIPGSTKLQMRKSSCRSNICGCASDTIRPFRSRLAETGSC